MTEHSKIPLPGEGNDKEPQPLNRESPAQHRAPSDSLLERASGAFGLENFGAAPVPRNLGAGPLKRARKVVRRGEAEAGGLPGEAQASPNGPSAAPPDQSYAPYAPSPAPQGPAPQGPAPQGPAPQRQPPHGYADGGAGHPEGGADYGQAPAAPNYSHYGEGVPQGYETPYGQDPHSAQGAQLPVPVPPSEVMLAQGPSPVVFRGEKHPVNRALLREKGLIVPEGAVSGLVEEFRIVKRSVMGAAAVHGTAAARRILVCSPLPGEGKSFCADNLAISMAGDKETEVLLVDADIAKPSVLTTFGLPSGPGLMDVLADPTIKIEDAVIGTDIPGLWVLPAGSSSRSDSEYLASTRTRQVLDQLTMGAPNRIVIFDSPPALAASPAAELAKHVGQTLLVVRADSTGQSALEDAYQLLSACPDVKLLLNGAQFSPSGRRFGSYYGYEG